MQHRLGHKELCFNLVVMCPDQLELAGISLFGLSFTKFSHCDA